MFLDLEFTAAQLIPEMLAQRLLVDLELLGDVEYFEEAAWCHRKGRGICCRSGLGA